MDDYRLDEVPSDDYLDTIAEYSSNTEDPGFENALNEEYGNRETFVTEDEPLDSGAGAIGGFIAGSMAGYMAPAADISEEVFLIWSLGTACAVLGNELEYQHMKKKLED